MSTPLHELGFSPFLLRCCKDYTCTLRSLEVIRRVAFWISTWEANWEQLGVSLSLVVFIVQFKVFIDSQFLKTGDCDLWRRARLQIKKKLRLLNCANNLAVDAGAMDMSTVTQQRYHRNWHTHPRPRKCLAHRWLLLYPTSCWTHSQTSKWRNYWLCHEVSTIHLWRAHIVDTNQAILHHSPANVESSRYSQWFSVWAKLGEPAGALRMFIMWDGNVSLGRTTSRKPTGK